MGGNISVKSKVGKGTTFKIELSTVCMLDRSQYNKLTKKIQNDARK